MIPVGIHKYSFQSAQDRVLALLKKEKGHPLSIEEISSALNIEMSTVVHVIHSIQHSYDLCQIKDKFYIPDNKVIHYLSAVGLILFCAYIFVDLIKYYHI